MSSPTRDSTRPASIIQTLCNAEGREVILRFKEPIRVPVGKYTGWSYEVETVPKTKVKAMINYASVEDVGETLMCFAEIELDQLGIETPDPPVDIVSQGNNSPDRCAAEIRATREVAESDVSLEEAKQAIENGREEAVLPPWNGLPTVIVPPKLTDKCRERYLESNGYIQFQAPAHKLGTLIDVRIK